MEEILTLKRVIFFDLSVIKKGFKRVWNKLKEWVNQFSWKDWLIGGGITTAATIFSPLINIGLSATLLPEFKDPGINHIKYILFYSLTGLISLYLLELTIIGGFLGALKLSKSIREYWKQNNSIKSTLWYIWGILGGSFITPLSQKITKQIIKVIPEDPYFTRRIYKDRIQKKLWVFDPSGKPFEASQSIRSMSPEKRYTTIYNIEKHNATTLHYDVTIQLPDGKVFRYPVPVKRDKGTGSLKGWNGIFPGFGENQTVKLSREHLVMTNAQAEKLGYEVNGKHKIIQAGKALVWTSENGNLHFQLEGIEPSTGGNFAAIPLKKEYGAGIYKITRLIPKEKDFPLLNGEPLSKRKMKEVEFESQEYKELLKDPNQLVTVKKDGTCIVGSIRDGKLRVWGYRVNKRLLDKSGIEAHHEYTHKRPEIEVTVGPKHLNMDFRGELWVRNDPDMSKLNASIQPDTLKARQSKFKTLIYLHDITSWDNKDVSNLPLKDKARLITQAHKDFPFLKEIPSASTLQGKKTLIKQAWKEEGVDGIVFWNLNSNEMTKVKKEHTDTGVIKTIVPEINKAGLPKLTGIPVVKINGIEQRMAGNFSQELKEDMLINPNKYIGAEVEIIARGTRDSGKKWQPVIQRIRPESMEEIEND